MATLQASNPDTCHGRHLAAARVQRIADKPVVNLSQKEKNQLLADIHNNAQWFGFGIECGHFSKWWEDQIFRRLEWASPAPDLLDAFVGAWLAVSLHMLNERNMYCSVQGGGNHCIKADVLEEGDWFMSFSHGLAVNLNVCKSLTSHFSSNYFTKADMVLRCAREIAKVLSQFGYDVGVSTRFLSLARAFAVQFPHDASRLLEEALDVTAIHAVELLPALGQYLLKIPSTEKVALDEAHNRIRRLIDAIDDPDNLNAPDLVARMRVAQEEFEHHLQGHRQRKRHRAGNERTFAELLITDVQPAQIIRGPIADITDGQPDLIGRGIRFNTNEWTFEQAYMAGPTAKDTIVHRNRLIATAIDGSISNLTFDHAMLTVKWPGGELRCPCWTVRSFQHAPRFKELGSSVVVFIYSDPPGMKDWQQYVDFRLLDVKYGRRN